MAFGWFTKAVSEVYEGRQFVFLSVDKKPLTISVDGKAQPVSGRHCFSRYGTRELTLPVDAKGTKRDFALGQAEPLRQICLVSDRLLYGPHDTPQLAAIVCPPRNDLRLVVQSPQQVVHEHNLGAAGSLSLHSLPPLTQGQYRASLVAGQSPLACCDFLVAQADSSTLSARLLSHQFSDDGSQMTFRVEVLQLGDPLSGPLTVGLCSGGQVVQSLTIECLDGVAESQFQTLPPGSVELHLATSDGATLSLPLKSSVQRVPMRLPGGLLVGTAPFSGSHAVAGLYFRQESGGDAPVQIVSSPGEAEVRFHNLQQPARVVVLDPLSGACQSSEPDGEQVRVPVTGPYSLVLAGMWQGAAPYETFSVAPGPAEKMVELECPARVSPTEELVVRVRRTTRGESGHCLLIVHDLALDRDELEPKLGRALLNHMAKLARGLGHGPVSLFDGSATQPGAEGADPSDGPTPSPRGPHSSQVACHWDVFPLNDAAERRIRMGPARGQCRVSAYLVTDSHAVGVHRDLEVARESYAELDVPTSMAGGERVEARVRYALPQSGELVITTAAGQERHAIAGKGALPLSLEGPTEVRAQITGGEFACAQIQSTGMRTQRQSRLVRLKAGQEVSGQIVVYPSAAYLLRSLTESLLSDPFNCAEQLASQLLAMAILLKTYEQGALPADGGKERLVQRIESNLNGLARLHHRGGGFSLWEERLAAGPDIRLSGQVLRCIAAYRRLNYPLAHEMQQATTERLIQAQLRDNRLFSLDRRFGAPLASNEDAVALYGAGLQKEASLMHLRQACQKLEDGSVLWKASPGWGSDLGVSCDVARLLLEVGDPLFGPALTYVTHHLIEGRLPCPADSRALIELVAHLPKTVSPQAEVDGAVVALSDVVRGTSVKALQDGLLVMLEEEVEVDDLQSHSNFKGSLALSKATCARGQRLSLTITPEEPARCALARIFLPGCLAFPGGSVQTAHLPIKGANLELPLTALRRGQGWIQVILHDLYHPPRSALLAPVAVEVV